MNCKRLTLLLMAIMVCATGCRNDHTETSKSRAPVKVNISLLNASTNDFDWVELIWTGPDVPGGIISPGKYGTAVGVEWPNLATAKLKLMDKKTAITNSVIVSLSTVNQQLQSAKFHDVTFRILGYDKAEVVCAPPE